MLKNSLVLKILSAYFLFVFAAHATMVKGNTYCRSESGDTIVDIVSYDSTQLYQLSFKNKESDIRFVLDAPNKEEINAVGSLAENLEQQVFFLTSLINNKSMTPQIELALVPNTIEKFESTKTEDESKSHPIFKFQSLIKGEGVLGLSSEPLLKLNCVFTSVDLLKTR